MNTTYSIWKPVDAFSNDIVKIAKNKIGLKNKVGHAGTLDPFAEGVLILCFGQHTKNVSEIMAMQKEYLAKIKLGIETDTLDRTGSVYKKSKIPRFDEQKILKVLNGFIGTIKQTPPPFSALKLNGKCLYEYARSGIRIIKKPRDININFIKLIEYGSDSITVKISCGSGTYVRSLAADIARKLGTHGHLEELKRLSVGHYNRKNSLTFKEFLNENIK